MIHERLEDHCNQCPTDLDEMTEQEKEEYCKACAVAWAAEWNWREAEHELHRA